MPIEHAAIIYGILSIIVFIFQLLLTLGFPLGHLAMGGKFPGVFSIKLRISAFFQGSLLIFFALILLSHSGVLTIPFLANNFILLAFVVLVSFISFILNIITPSFYERVLWGPVTGGLFFSSCVVVFY